MSIEYHPYAFESESVCRSIKKLAQNSDALENLESYLSQHFAVWLEKYANNPASLAEELNQFAVMFDE